MFPELSVRRALLLQGPMGPFFRRFARELSQRGVEVTKVNFNAGDAVYYPTGALSYRGSFAAFPDYLRNVIRERAIDGMFVFGDGRPYHRKAIEVARALGVRVFVFEEGYLRPDYITLEGEGVNGHSCMPRDPAFYKAYQDDIDANLSRPLPVGHTFRYGAWHSTVYSLAMTLGFWLFPRYVHHRRLNAISQAYYWVRAGIRKLVYARRERGVIEQLVSRHSQNYFLVALQVHTDYQLAHSSFASVEAFIQEVVHSFHEHAAAGCRLVIKHHPMDRGYTDYTELIRSLSARYGLGDRLIYVHDLHLPTLLRHSRGAVMINSTVGLSAIALGTPVKVLGRAVYDMAGFTHQGTFDSFWSAPEPVDLDLYRRFRAYLLRHNQANGNFMHRLSGLTNPTGVRWFPGP